MAEVEESKKLESESPSDPPPAPTTAPVEKEKPLLEDPKDHVSHKDKSEIPQPPPPESKAEPDESKALTTIVDKLSKPITKEKSKKGSIIHNDVLAKVATEKRLSLIRAWEESEKSRAKNKVARKTEAPPPGQNPVDHDDQMVDDDPSSTVLDLTSFRFHDLDSVELSPSLTELDLTMNRLTGLDSRITTLSNLKKLSLRKNLIRFTDSGDVLFVHYNGHGTCLPAEIDDDDDTGYDECIVPTDMNLIAELPGLR
ncbi:hypothetical protein ACFX1T_022617 [Malus domestica]